METTEENELKSVVNNSGGENSAQEVNTSNLGSGSGSLPENYNLGGETLTSKLGNMNLGAAPANSNNAAAATSNNAAAATSNNEAPAPTTSNVVAPPPPAEVKTKATKKNTAAAEAKRKPSEVQNEVRQNIQVEAHVRGYEGALKPQLKYVAPLASLKYTNPDEYQQKLDKYVDALVAGNKNPNIGFVRTNAQKAKTERNKKRKAEKKAAEAAAKGLPVPPLPTTKAVTKKATKIYVSKPTSVANGIPSSSNSDVKKAVYYARKEMIRAVKDTMYAILKQGASPRKTHKVKKSASKSKTRSK